MISTHGSIVSVLGPPFAQPTNSIVFAERITSDDVTICLGDVQGNTAYFDMLYYAEGFSLGMFSWFFPHVGYKMVSVVVK